MIELLFTGKNINHLPVKLAAVVSKKRFCSVFSNILFLLCLALSSVHPSSGYPKLLSVDLRCLFSPRGVRKLQVIVHESSGLATVGWQR